MPRAWAAARPSADLRRDIEQLAAGDRAPLDGGAERLALDQLGDDVRLSRRTADVVDRDDVRVVQRAGSARLLLETLTADRVAGNVRGQDLDRDGTVQARVLGPPHLAHATLAELVPGCRSCRVCGLS